MDDSLSGKAVLVIEARRGIGECFATAGSHPLKGLVALNAWATPTGPFPAEPDWYGHRAS